MTNTNTSNKKVLIIGATGALGLQLLRHIAEEPSIDEVHIMARTPSKLDDADSKLAKSIQQGDARNPKDIKAALRATKANFVILSTGNGHDVKKSDTRQSTGHALAKVLSSKKDVQAIVMSSQGAAETKVIVGMGVGKLISFYLRHVFADHTHQEAEFASDDLKKRTLIVRPTSLTDNKPVKDFKTGIVEFDGTKKSPTINIDRSDVAAWVVREIASNDVVVGRKVCLTNAK